MLRKGQIQRQFSDETDDTRSVETFNDALYDLPRARRRAGEVGEVDSEIAQVISESLSQEDTEEQD